MMSSRRTPQEQRLWAPWRITYVQQGGSAGCIFCRKPREHQDARNHIVTRKKLVYSLLNIYPYNNGHVMVAPFRHVGELEKLTIPEQRGLLALVTETVRILKKSLKPQGFNIGMNIGRMAGAGFDRHLHVHIVPRWKGDTNFMPVVAETKVISQSLNELYRMLKS